MNHIAISKDSDDLADRIGLADIGQELIAKARALRCALDDACDINEGERGWKKLFRAEDLSELG